jgi:hypothetical protein
MKEVRRVVEVGFTVVLDVGFNLILILWPRKCLTLSPSFLLVRQKYEPFTVTPDQSKEIERLQGGG